MKMKPSSLIFIFLLCSFITHAKEDLKMIPYSTYVYGKSDTFLISSKPVTNREYIMYFLWNMTVYGADYPKVVSDMIPGQLSLEGTSSGNIYGFSEKINWYLNRTEPFVKNYIFNPIYLDYPVIGLSWYQASRMNKWLTDRYNESKLIKYKHLLRNINQIGEDCFVTESYVYGQYFGLRREKIDPEAILLWYYWNEHVLLPTFRLPTDLELRQAKQNGAINQNITSYPSKKKHFLKIWYDIFMKEINGNLYIRSPFYLYQYEIIGGNNLKWNINQYVYEEMVLNIDSSSVNMAPLDVFVKNGQPKKNVEYYNMEIKDSLGILPFLIVDENEKKQPISVEMYNRANVTKLDSNKFYYFRFACSISPGQYKP